MARSVQLPGIVLVLAVVLAAPGASHAQSATTGRQGNIQFSARVPLTPGSHRVTVLIDGKQYSAQVTLAAAPRGGESTGTPGRASAGEVGTTAGVPLAGGASVENSPPPAASSLPLILAAMIPLLLAAIGALVYFKVLLPRRHERPYREALELLKAGQYREALPHLTQLESKLPDSLRTQARFFIAFANYQLHNITEAELLLASLHRENPRNAEIAYLLAHLRVEARRYEEAEPVLTMMETNQQLNVHHARRLLGIVTYQQAMAAYRVGNLDEATTLFKKVEALADFADKIPADLRNRQIALGTKALFEKEVIEARKQFESLEKTAEGTEDARLKATAKIGLALASWIDDTAEGDSRVESLLVEAAKLLAPSAPVEQPWPEEETPQKKKTSDRIKDLEAESRHSPEERSRIRLLRDLHFLRGMTALRAWRRLPAPEAHQQTAARYKAAISRFACARALEDTFSDVLLVVGLLMYYLMEPGPTRSRGVDLLEEARQQGMRDPDALEIVNNRARIEQANTDKIQRLLELLDKFLNDETVRKEIRQSLLDQLSRYGRFKKWDKRPDLAHARMVEPSVAEVREQSELLVAHIEQIISSESESEDVRQMRSLTQQIRKNGEQLYYQAQTIHETESELLKLTGARLFRE